ncbi:helix-turn-helix domain-containing protein, partial [Sphingobium cloacae]
HLRDEHDLSFQDLLSAVRVEKAQHYLRTTNMSATQIAYLVGYSDPSNFSRAFRAQVGSSVREWVATNEPQRRRNSLARRRNVI